MDKSSFPHPWSRDARMERLEESTLDGLWRPTKNGVNCMSLLQLHGSMNSNKALREYAGKNPILLEAFIRARPHLYSAAEVVTQGSTAVHVYRRSEDFRRSLVLLINYIQSKGAATMMEIRKLLNDHGYAGVVSQLWHDCTPSVSACVRCSTPFTAEMGSIFEWANYENRLVASKAGVVDDVVLLNWRERFIDAGFLPETVPRTKTGGAAVAQIYKDHGTLRPLGPSGDVVIEFGPEACGLPPDTDLRDYFRIDQQDVIYEARVQFGFQLFQDSCVFSRHWRAVSITQRVSLRKEAKGLIKESSSRVHQSTQTSSTDWMKLVESELKYISDEQADGTCSSVGSGNGYWHEEEW